MLLQAPVALPTPAPPAEGRPPRRPWPTVRSWLLLLVAVVARMARSALLTLLAVATLPSLWHWSSYAVLSGSMEPGMSPGDVVIGAPFGEDDKVPVGRVMIFEDPGDATGDGAGRLLVHRVVEKRDDGTWTTAGDANGSLDVTPVAREGFRARAVLLVPAMAKPYLWITEGRWLALGLTALGATVVFWLAMSTSRRVGRRAKRWQHYRPAIVGGLVAVLIFGVTLSRADAAGAAFTSRTSSKANAWKVPLRPDTYGAAVRADSPYYFWRMDETGGPTAHDASGDGSRNGTYSGGVTFGQPNAPRNLGASITLTGANGSGGRVVANASFNPNDSFTHELWFKTTTKQGGKLLGLENANGSTAERTLYMRADGTVGYGAWQSPHTNRLISTPLAYNDGRWHHLVLTSAPDAYGAQFSSIYVDGIQVVSSTQTTTHTDFSGSLRVGYGVLYSNSGALVADFNGSIDEVATYGGRLSGARIKAHYDAKFS